MQAFHAPAGMPPAPAVRMNRRVAIAAAVVVALHAVLIAVVLAPHDTVKPVSIESRTITAELLQPAPPAAPPALQSTPTPAPREPTPPVARETPKPPPKAHPKPQPAPLPRAQAPSRHSVETAPTPPAPTPAPAPAPEAARVPPTPPAPAPAAAAAAATAQAKPTMALSAPKNVSHLDCRIAQPDYPMLSRRRGESGTAYVRFVVGLTGRIEDVELKKSSGYDRLDAAAVAAMHDSSCKPYLENGEPVRAAYTQPFAFSLQD